MERFKEREEKRKRLRGDRPEFVQLESRSPGITSQNGQTQTEDRKMDVRGCKKGKGGTVKKRKEGGRATTSAQSASGVEGQIEDEQREGQNMEKTQHDNDKNEN